jgi:hypothetical protein
VASCEDGDGSGGGIGTCEGRSVSPNDGILERVDIVFMRACEDLSKTRIAVRKCEAGAELAVAQANQKRKR